MDNGPSIAAAFGSESRNEIEELHMIMREMVRISPRSSAFDGMASSHGDDESKLVHRELRNNLFNK